MLNFFQRNLGIYSPKFLCFFVFKKCNININDVVSLVYNREIQIHMVDFSKLDAHVLLLVEQRVEENEERF